MHLTLWIDTYDSEADAAYLRTIGITPGPFEPRNCSAHIGTFRHCHVTPEAFVKLEPWWMKRFVWGEERACCTPASYAVNTVDPSAGVYVS